MHKIPVIDFIFYYMLYMFLPMLVHHQEQPFISCTSHLVYACFVAVATQQPDVSAYTKCDVQLIKGCS